MTDRKPLLRRLAPLLMGLVVTLALLMALAIWVQHGFVRHFIVPHSIYGTGQLVNVYHAHRAKTGNWPAPGEYVAKEVTFVGSYHEKRTRVDVFNFGGGQYVLLELHSTQIMTTPARTIPPATTKPSFP